MSRQANAHGGGARTNANGLHFEQTTSLDSALTSAGYRVRGCEVYDGSHKIELSVPKQDFYRYFLESEDIDYTDFNSKKWLPDECYVNLEKNTVYIIEKKFQNSSSLVDEKLTNCDFKRKEYEKLCKPLKYEVKYCYILNNWFTKGKYRDTLEYIKSVGCDYFYNEIPLEFLGLRR